MDPAILEKLNRAVDSADKLIRWQIAVMGALIAGAVWCTSINMRLASIESDRQTRIPVAESWRFKKDREDQKRDDLLTQFGASLTDHGTRITDLEHGQRQQLRQP